MRGVAAGRGGSPPWQRTGNPHLTPPERGKLARQRRLSLVSKVSPGQKSLWQNWNLPVDEVQEISKKFVLANCFDPSIAALQFTDTS